MFPLGLSDREFFRQTAEILDSVPEPFYAFCITASSHYPYGIPLKDREIVLKPEDEQTLFGLYMQAINYADRAIGEFLDELKEAGLYDNSIFLIYGDHYALPNTAEETALLTVPADEAEQLGVVLSPTIMRTEMEAVVREADRQTFLRQDHVTVAVNEGNTNYDLFLADNYPDWGTAYFADTPACLKAVAAGEADCIIISNYRFSNISKQCEELHLTTVSTGVALDYSFAVRQGDTTLYSILSRVTGLVPSTTMSASLTYYSTADAKTSLTDTVKDNLPIILGAVAAVLLIILLLVLRLLRVERKANRKNRPDETDRE